MTHLLPTTTAYDTQVTEAEIAVLPIGSFEQHGRYLPLITDTVVASVISRELAASYPILALPPVTVSCSHEHHAWPGTVSISAKTLFSIVEDVYDSVSGSGLKGLVVLNGHGGNYVLSNIVQEGSAKGRKMALFPTAEDWKDARAAAGLVSSMHEDMHAGELESSILLHTHPELLRPGFETSDHVHDDRRHLLTVGMSSYTETGVIGRPSLGSADKGKAILENLVDGFAEVLNLLLSEHVQS